MNVAAAAGMLVAAPRTIPMPPMSARTVVIIWLRRRVICPPIEPRAVSWVDERSQDPCLTPGRRAGLVFWPRLVQIGAHGRSQQNSGEPRPRRVRAAIRRADDRLRAAGKAGCVTGNEPAPSRRVLDGESGAGQCMAHWAKPPFRLEPRWVPPACPDADRTCARARCCWPSCARTAR
jgi:hypothetical protein